MSIYGHLLNLQTMIRAVIIENRYDRNDLLKKMLQTYFKEVILVGNATRVSSGIEVIKALQPSLVFLDTHISEGNGFDVLDAFNPVRFKIVFVTRDEKYALKAIKYSALDYLLKPIILDELRLAIKKTQLKSPRPKEDSHFSEENLTPRNTTNQIILSGHKGLNIINIEHILYIEAQRSYVIFHLNKNQNRIASNALSFYEDLLPIHKFFRIHKSYIINCDQIIQLEKGRGGMVKLIGGRELPIAIRRKTSFLKFINNRSSSNYI